ncbi:AIPR family protein [Lactobacillaceae bacterium L1_55_11]|nr:AIPR family protein [Lactobacillaceae bacterium L1_55_11]
MKETPAFKNSKILLQNDFDEYKRQFKDTEYNDDQIFEIFSSENYFKNRNLSITEITSCLVDNENDWGVDGFFIFRDGQLITNIDEIDDNFYIENDSETILQELGIDDSKGGASSLEVFIFQYKNKGRIEENVLNKFLTFAKKLSDLTIDYGELIRDQIMDVKLVKFLYVLHALIGKNNAKSKNTIKMLHVAMADTKQIAAPYEQKQKDIKTELEQSTLFDESDVSIVGVYELLQLSKLSIPTDVNLKGQSSQTISTEFGSENESGTNNVGYIATIKINDYFNFITVEDENGTKKLNEKIFETNVRDYKTKSSINSGIEETVKLGAKKPDEQGADFWWLNNGITILADDGNMRGSQFNLQNVQIVNGLQTSFSVFNALKDADENTLENDKQSVFVKIIITSDEKIRDEIIKSTNSQNSISPSDLRATDPIQRNIEKFLMNKGFYYDRRKNYHRNHGISIANIFSINYLVQALVSIVKQNPSEATRKPTSLTSNDVTYNSLFSNSKPLNAYYAAIKIRNESKISSKKNNINVISSNSTTNSQNPFELHVCRVVGSLLTQKKNPNFFDLDELVKNTNKITVSKEMINQAVDIVRTALEHYRATDVSSKSKTLSAIAKQKDFSEFVTEELINAEPNFR